MKRYCVLIPHYDHHAPLGDLLDGIGAPGLPVIVVDDGSDEASRRVVERLAAERADVELLSLSPNRGKGAAVIHGMQAAARRGYTHAVQIDADACRSACCPACFFAPALQ